MEKYPIGTRAATKILESTRCPPPVNARRTGRRPNEALLGAERWILEDIRIPEDLITRQRCYLFAFPILLQGCGGAFVRAVAMLNDAEVPG